MLPSPSRAQKWANRLLHPRQILTRRARINAAHARAIAHRTLLESAWPNLELDLSAQRDQLLSEVLRHAHQECPYYTKALNEAGFNPRDFEPLAVLSSLPLLDKTVIREQGANMISKKREILPMGEANTGGSTGAPLKFLSSAEAGCEDYQHQEFLYRLLGFEDDDIIVAFDGSSVPDDLLQNNIFWVENELGDIPYGRLSYSSLYWNERTAPFYIAHLNALRPAILRGYPSFLDALSRYLLQHNLKLEFPIKAVELTAENAMADQTSRIREALQTRVFFQYGHTEAAVFGWTAKEEGEYFCSPLYGWTEILDESGSHVAPGEAGEIVVTGFHNRVQPFIRYRTGDVAVYAGQSNGFVRLESIVGRTQDFLYNSTMEPIALTALVFGQHFRAFAHIERWQLIQELAGKVIVRVVPLENWSEADAEEIKQTFREKGGIEAQVERVEEIALTGRGKFRFVLQKLNP